MLTILACGGLLVVVGRHDPAPPVASGRSGPCSSGDGKRSLPTRVQTGLNSGSSDRDHRVAGLLGARLVRVEFPIGASVASMRADVASVAQQGARVLPLAGFGEGVPTAGQARSLRRWAQEFGPGGRFWRDRSDGRLAIRDIEFGNETSYPARDGSDDEAGRYATRAQTYGRRAMTAIDALDGTRVGLMVQAEDAGLSANWVTNMCEAAPGLGDRVSAWTVHPYGEDWEARLHRVVDDTAAAGAPPTVPIAVTEWGLATAGGRCLDDNYGWDRCMSYATAGRIGRDVVSGIQRALDGRLGTFIMYSTTDLDFSGATEEREDYFGATTTAGTAKGAYTAFARDLLSGRLIG